VTGPQPRGHKDTDVIPTVINNPFLFSLNLNPGNVQKRQCRRCVPPLRAWVVTKPLLDQRKCAPHDRKGRQEPDDGYHRKDDLTPTRCPKSSSRAGLRPGENTTCPVFSVPHPKKRYREGKREIRGSGGEGEEQRGTGSGGRCVLSPQILLCSPYFALIVGGGALWGLRSAAMLLLGNGQSPSEEKVAARPWPRPFHRAHPEESIFFPPPACRSN